MESNHELKQIHIKNCTCCYFDGLIKIEHFDFDFDWKYENILFYEI